MGGVAVRSCRDHGSANDARIPCLLSLGRRTGEMPRSLRRGRGGSWQSRCRCRGCPVLFDREGCAPSRLAGLDLLPRWEAPSDPRSSGHLPRLRQGREERRARQWPVADVMTWSPAGHAPQRRSPRGHWPGSPIDRQTTRFRCHPTPLKSEGPDLSPVCDTVQP